MQRNALPRLMHAASTRPLSLVQHEEVFATTQRPASLFDELDTWIRMRLRSTVIRRHATHLSNVKMPNRVLVGVGLVSLGALRRTTRSPV